MNKDDIYKKCIEQTAGDFGISKEKCDEIVQKFCLFIDDKKFKFNLLFVLDFIFQNIFESYKVQSAEYKKIKITTKSKDIDNNSGYRPKNSKASPSDLKLKIKGEYKISETVEDWMKDEGNDDWNEDDKLSRDEMFDIIKKYKCISFGKLRSIKNGGNYHDEEDDDSSDDGAKGTSGMKMNEDYLPWFEEIDLEDRIYTFTEVAEIFYKIKTHRFDDSYDLISKINIEDDSLVIYFNHSH